MSHKWMSKADLAPPKEDQPVLEFWCPAWDCPVYVQWYKAKKSEIEMFEGTGGYWRCLESVLDELGFEPEEQITHWRYATLNMPRARHQ